MDRKSILLVDEEKGILDQAKVFLEREDETFDITTTDSIHDALSFVDEYYFDAVVSAYNSIDIDGIEFLKTLREERGIDIPFILFIDKDRDEIVKKALEKGANGYIVKSGDPKKKYKILAEIIDQEMNRHRTKTEVFRNEKRYMQVFDNTRDGLLLIDAETGVIEEVSSGLLNLLGTSKDDLMGEKIWDIEAFQNLVKDKNLFKEIVKEETYLIDETILGTKNEEISVELVMSKFEVGYEKFVQFHFLRSNIQKNCMNE
ncbi:MAG: response regulator, partial [Thermoplasmatota archaeon]